MNKIITFSVSCNFLSSCNVRRSEEYMRIVKLFLFDMKLWLQNRLHNFALVYKYNNTECYSRRRKVDVRHRRNK